MLYLIPESVNRFRAPRETICYSSFCPQSVLALHSAIWYIKHSHIHDHIWCIWPWGWQTHLSPCRDEGMGKRNRSNFYKVKGVWVSQNLKLLALFIPSVIIKTMIPISSIPYYKTECLQIIPTNFDSGLWKNIFTGCGGYIILGRNKFD